MLVKRKYIDLVDRYGHDPIDDYYDNGAKYGPLPNPYMNASQIEEWCKMMAALEALKEGEGNNESNGIPSL